MLTGGTRPYHSQEPFLSIITVVYNSQYLLQDTINSIAQQSSNDYEYLVIDALSKDKTIDIIKANEHHINYWQSESDKGLYDAMNKGLSLAKGRFVLFLNSGDWLNNAQVIEELQKKSLDADIIYGETNLMDAHNTILGTRTDLTTRKLPKKLTWESLKMGMVVCHQSILVNRIIAPRFRLQYKCSADIDWVIESLKQSKNTVHSGLIISKYLVGGFSAINQKLAIRERFTIFVHHYGWLQTCLAYCWIAIRGLMFKLQGKTNY